MAGLTLQQLQSMGAKPVTAPAKTGGQTLAQLQAPTISAPLTADSIWQSLANAGNTIKTAAQGGISQIQDAAQKIENPAPNTNPIIGGVEAGLEGESGLASVVTSPLAPVMKPVSDVINAIGNKISDVPLVQQFANSSAGQITARVAQDVANAGNVAGTILGADQVVKAPTKISAALDTIKQHIDSIGDNTPPAAAPLIADTVPTKTEQIINKGAQDWQKPADTPTASFNKARQALEQAPDSPKFLAQQGLSPFSHIEDGRYATGDTADALRTTAAKMSADTLRPSLQMADYSTPKTPIASVVSDALSNLDNTKGITAADKETAAANIQKEASALTTKYPNGLSLENLHDEKITYAQNSGYKPLAPALDNIKATANRVLSSALGKTLEDAAPKSIPVKEFNSYLSKYYKAADYLDTLDTKKAPVSTMQYVAHKAAQVIGAGVGHTVGGGILGGVGGYMIGGALEHAVENMSVPMRATFIRNLEITKPEVIPQVEAYLRAQHSGNTGILRLKAPDTNSPIPLGPTTAKVSVAPYAERGPVGITSKGRFTKTYKSTPK